MKNLKQIGLFAAALSLLLLAACGGNDSKKDEINPVVITIAPETARVEAEKSTPFTVKVQGTQNTDFTVTLSPNTGSYTINGNTVTYTAPDNVAVETTVILTVTAAADSTKTTAATITVTPPPDDPEPPVEQNIDLQGRVKDVDGNPISGVRVFTGNINATTGNDGTFNLQRVNVIDGLAVIRFEKSGYFTLTRSGIKKDEMFIEAVLYPKSNSNISQQTTFSASGAATLTVPAGMKIELPASSLASADGSAYTGSVNADVLYLDPNDKNFASMMPGGNLTAIRSNDSEAMLVSWGMVDVNLTDNSGNPLQIKNGSSAELTFPIPAGMENNPPPTIPLWHFDENKGIWIETGIATLQGDLYVGAVTHFSWINLDVPEERVTIKGRVVDCENQPVPGIFVEIGQTTAVTDRDGYYSAYAPENTSFEVKITANGSTDSKVVPGNQAGGSTYTVADLSLKTCDVKITGRVIGCDNQPVSDVLVKIGDISAITKSDGSYSAFVSKDTSINVSVNTSVSGYYGYASDAQNVPGQSVNTTYTVPDLKPCGAIISGKVINCENKPVPYVWVGVGSTGAWTNGDGYYTALIPENTPVKVETYYGYGLADSKNVPGQSGGSDTYNVPDLKLCGVTIAGRVIDCKEQPIPYATVIIGQTYTVTDTGGYYSAVVPENTPVAVSAYEYGYGYRYGYISDSKNVSGQSGGTTYAVPNLKLCEVTITGRVIDCKDQPVPYTMVLIGQAYTVTDFGGHYSAVVPENILPVTVSVNANGGSNSNNVLKQPGNTTYTVRDLKVPCVETCKDETCEGEPGAMTNVEKASVKYLYPSVGTFISTFDKNGKRVRYDFIEEGVHVVTIVDSIEKTYWYYAPDFKTSDLEEMLKFGVIEAYEVINGATWVKLPYDQWSIEGNVTYLESYFDEATLEYYKQFKQPDNVVIAGKSCEVYIFTENEVEFKVAVWNGLMMLMEEDSIVSAVAQAVTFDVPDTALTKTLNITWIQ